MSFLDDRALRKSIAIDYYRIVVSFPLQSMFIIETLAEHMLVRLPYTDKRMSWLEVHLKEPLVIKGFGMPFAYPRHQSEGFINHDVAIHSKTLVDIL